MSFCQICRHDTPGHFEGCPVLTGEPQMGFQGSFSQQWQGQHAQQGFQLSEPGYGVSDTDHRILLELADIKTQLRQIKEMLAKKLPSP